MSSSDLQKSIFHANAFLATLPQEELETTSKLAATECTELLQTAHKVASLRPEIGTVEDNIQGYITDWLSCTWKRGNNHGLGLLARWKICFTTWVIHRSDKQALAQARMLAILEKTMKLPSCKKIDQNQTKECLWAELQQTEPRIPHLTAFLSVLADSVVAMAQVTTSPAGNVKQKWDLKVLTPDQLGALLVAASAARKPEIVRHLCTKNVLGLSFSDAIASAWEHQQFPTLQALLTQAPNLETHLSNALPQAALLEILSYVLEHDSLETINNLSVKLVKAYYQTTRRYDTDSPRLLCETIIGALERREVETIDTTAFLQIISSIKAVNNPQEMGGSDAHFLDTLWNAAIDCTTRPGSNNTPAIQISITQLQAEEQQKRFPRGLA